ncbi:hypothetical protein DUNSADRAFT_5654 [Dunaliella salina]|uniref:Encoded protein n=1 Tax=Dunaliella salina TaxID=3046 RepID=A0ABQ7GPU3_DUNSA|nr:hypothetical protein DUNSADRAFT_5654 [Dunaliella salina]|eukprot:KAF5836621.1 hypothetical protein DUNSADRAFT_5654 [Dunaliella salina]
MHLRQGTCTANGLLQAKNEQHSAHGALIRNPQAFAWCLFMEKAGKPAHESGLGRLERAFACSHSGQTAPISEAAEAAPLDTLMRLANRQPPPLKTHSYHDSFLAGLYAAQVQVYLLRPRLVHQRRAISFLKPI